MYNEGIPVSEYTEQLLKSREDDLRIDMIRELMFGDDIGGMFPARTITLAGEEGKEDVSVILRKATQLDTYAYLKTPGDSIKTAIRTLHDFAKTVKALATEFLLSKTYGFSFSSMITMRSK